jgi:hypothetical protein
VQDQDASKKLRLDPDLILGKLSNLDPLPVEEILSVEDFLERYKKLGHPVVVRGAVDDWPALQGGGEHRWSVSYLKKVHQVIFCRLWIFFQHSSSE